MRLLHWMHPPIIAALPIVLAFVSFPSTTGNILNLLRINTPVVSYSRTRRYRIINDNGIANQHFHEERCINKLNRHSLFVFSYASPFSFSFNTMSKIVVLIALSKTSRHNLICLEFRRQFTLFDRKRGFSVNAIRCFCKTLIRERQITTGDSRQNEMFLQKAWTFFKDGLHEENYTAKPCITKKIFTLISINCKNSVKSSWNSRRITLHLLNKL